MKNLISLTLFCVALSVVGASKYVDYITGFLNGDGDTKKIGCLAKKIEDGPVV